MDCTLKKKILNYLLIVGWATRAPLAKGGQDAHPTSSSNLFVGNVLAIAVILSITTSKKALTLLRGLCNNLY
ncbi:MAG: hypothetical protein V7K27_07430 [Nostoc sp.]|uniref:hypothetical protein n=1 Tax=Nostoc sp. TaxID=1180 RepID=UPI002FF980D6